MTVTETHEVTLQADFFQFSVGTTEDWGGEDFVPDGVDGLGWWVELSMMLVAGQPFASKVRCGLGWWVELSMMLVGAQPLASKVRSVGRSVGLGPVR